MLPVVSYSTSSHIYVLLCLLNVAIQFFFLPTAHTHARTHAHARNARKSVLDEKVLKSRLQ